MIPAGDRVGRLAMALVALGAASVWGLVPTWWLSDDYLAISYANDPCRALADFAGPQYSAPAMVRLYRPLITLSFAFDAWLGGGAPLVSHLSNVLAHALSAALVVALGVRLLGRGAGIAAGALWALWPAHAGSILWAVGRVDSHTTLWILLALWLTVRWLDGGGRAARAGSLLAFAAALLSKELALATPALVALLALALGPPGARGRAAVKAALPFALLLLPYFAVRYAALGRLLGGYDDAQFAPGAALAGLGTWLLRLANPLWDLPGAPVPPALAWLGFLPAGLGVALALRAGRGAALALLAAGLLAAALPTAPFWAETGEIKNLRYLYLPATCALAIVALGGPLPRLLAAAVLLVPLARTLEAWRAGHAVARGTHAALRAAAEALPPGPLFVSGLPRQTPDGSVLLFHLWVDRLLAPPFGDGRRLFALRPLVERPGVLRSPFGETAGLIEGQTLRLDAGEAAPPARALPASPLPRFPVAIEGTTDIDNGVLWDLHLERARIELTAPGVTAPWLRLTLFTAGGYLCSVLRNEAAGGGGARVPLKAWLTARYGTEGDDAHVLFALPAAATFDLDARFPLLLEAGDAPGGDPARFTPSAVAERFAWLRFPRDLAEYVGGRVPDPRR